MSAGVICLPNSSCRRSLAPQNDAVCGDFTPGRHEYVPYGSPRPRHSGPHVYLPRRDNTSVTTSTTPEPLAPVAQTPIARRTVLAGAAWSVPAIALTTASPAFAASGTTLSFAKSSYTGPGCSTINGIKVTASDNGTARQAFPSPSRCPVASSSRTVARHPPASPAPTARSRCPASPCPQPAAPEQPQRRHRAHPARRRLCAARTRPLRSTYRTVLRKPRATSPRVPSRRSPVATSHPMAASWMPRTATPSLPQVSLLSARCTATTTTG